MSKSNKEVQEQQSEKVVTKYDLKMQRRKEQKDKEQRDKRIGTIGGIVLVAALACLVASFPIRTWLTVNGTYIKVGGENISRVEFDYHYNMASNNYISQNYYMLYYFGVDLSGDLTKQMYSETLTWKDYFDQLAVDQIAQNKALVKEARNAGFTYDTTEEYNEFLEALKETASEAGTSTKEYIQRMYGVYATQARVKPFLEESLYAAAYVDEVAEGMTPSREEIQAYYDENKASYDSVDYYIFTVDAELPTEPTELADPVEPAEGSNTEGSSDSDGSTDGTGSGEEAAYEPSEAEIAAAMEKAKAEAERAEKSIKTTGELMTNIKRSSSVFPYYSVSSWLFDEERKAGDTTVIENAASHCYYVVGFEDRYLDQTLTVDLRVAIISEGNGQEILDEWKSGAATEESFGEICDKYMDSSVSVADGGLTEGVAPSQLPDELKEWVMDSARKAGDTTVITPEEDAYTYVLYYVAPNQEEWVLDIQNTLLNEKLGDYLDAMAASVEVEDPKGNLAYLSIPSEDENGQDADGEGTSGSEGSSEGEGASGSEGSSEGGGASGSEGSSDGEGASGSESSSSGE